MPGDKSAMNPSGIRLGTPSLTTRGFNTKDMDQVVAFIHSALELAIQVQRLLRVYLVFTIIFDGFHPTEKLPVATIRHHNFA